MRAVAILVSLLGLPAVVAADGLIYQLPEDGVSALYEVTFSPNGQSVEKGTFRVASVGTEMVEGKPCRWIELMMTTVREERERTIVGKVLVPEERLTRGQHPFEHVVRGYVRFQDQAPEQLDRRNQGPIPVFLAGPYDDDAKQDPETLDTKLGKLECEVVLGTGKHKEGEREMLTKRRVWLSDKAPFGMAAIRMEMKSGDGGGPQGTAEMKLIETGKDTKTALPDSK
jgi:hypothetical protein